MAPLVRPALVQRFDISRNVASLQRMILLERPQALLADSFFASFDLLSAKIGATG